MPAATRAMTEAASVACGGRPSGRKSGKAQLRARAARVLLAGERNSPALALAFGAMRWIGIVALMVAVASLGFACYAWYFAHSQWLDPLEFPRIRGHLSAERRGRPARGWCS